MCTLVSLSSNSIATELSTMISRLLLAVTYGLLLASGTTNAAPVNIQVFSAIVNFSYVDPVSRTELIGADVGRFGVASHRQPESGIVVHVRSDDGLHHGCGLPVNIPHGDCKWIALVRRGDCKFNEKIHNAAVLANASAVVVYNHKDEETLITMRHLVVATADSPFPSNASTSLAPTSHISSFTLSAYLLSGLPSSSSWQLHLEHLSIDFVKFLMASMEPFHHRLDDVVSVFIHKHQGERIAKLVDSGVTVTMDISVGQALSVYNAALNETDHHDHKNRLSPIGFISLAIVMLMTCALGVFLVYAIRRARYLRTKPTIKAVFTLPARQQQQQQQQEGLLTIDCHDSGYFH